MLSDLTGSVDGFLATLIEFFTTLFSTLFGSFGSIFGGF